MADDAIHTLICLIEGDSSLFPVDPTGNMRICDLQDLIKEENKNGVLNGVDPSDLILWKVTSL
jgi:Crinkler effector protein N-terminal domain